MPAGLRNLANRRCIHVPYLYARQNPNPEGGCAVENNVHFRFREFADTLAEFAKLFPIISRD